MNKLYYKVKLQDIIQEWIDRSNSESILDIRISQPDMGGFGDQYALIEYEHNKVPVSLYLKYPDGSLTKDQARLEVNGGIWQ